MEQHEVNILPTHTYEVMNRDSTVVCVVISSLYNLMKGWMEISQYVTCIIMVNKVPTIVLC